MGGRLLDCLLHHVGGRSTRCARVNLIDLAHCDVLLTRVRSVSKADSKPSGADIRRLSNAGDGFGGKVGAVNTIRPRG